MARKRRYKITTQRWRKQKANSIIRVKTAFHPSWRRRRQPDSSSTDRQGDRQFRQKQGKNSSSDSATDTATDQTLKKKKKLLTACHTMAMAFTSPPCLTSPHPIPHPIPHPLKSEIQTEKLYGSSSVIPQSITMPETSNCPAYLGGSSPLIPQHQILPLPPYQMQIKQGLGMLPTNRHGCWLLAGMLL